MIIRDLLKAGVVSQVYVAEGVNGGLETKVVGQWVGSGSRIRVGGEVEWGASRGVGWCASGRVER